MIHKQTLVGVDIDIFTNIYVNRVEKMVKDFKSHIFVLDFDRIFLRLIVKENK